MRTARLVPLALALALAGCGGTTFPWTTNGSGSTGGGGGGATVALSTSTLSFSAVQGGGAPTSKSVTLSASGAVPPTLYVTVTNGGPPVASATFAVVSGVGLVTVSVVAPTTVGTTTGTVTVHVYADSAGTQELGGSPATLGVTYAVAPAPVPGSFSVSPTALTFSALQGDPAPAPKDLTVTTQVGSSGAVYLSAQPSGISGATAVLDTSVSPAVVHVTMPAPGTTSTSGNVYVYAYEDAAHLKPLPGSPKAVPVTYTVTASQLAASPTSLTFSAPAGVAPGTQDVALSDAIGSASWTSSVSYGVGSGSGWLTVTPSSGASLPATATVSLAPQSSPATYQATITFSARGVSRVVSVSYVSSRPKVVASPTSLALSCIRGQTPTPDATALTVTSEGGAALGYTTAVTYGPTASGWLTVPASGTTGDTMNVALATTSLPPGHHTATLRLTPSNGAAPTDVPIALDVAAPALAVAPASVQFTVDTYATAADLSRWLAVIDSGAPISWTATVTSAAPWLQLSTTSGTTGGVPGLTLSLVTAELETVPRGTYSTEVAFTYVEPSGPTVVVRVPVTLVMTLPMVDYVMPRVAVQGSNLTVELRGGYFDQGIQVRFGDTPATSTLWVSGSELMPATPWTLAPGSYPVWIYNAAGLKRTRASLDVVATATRTATSIASAGTKTKAIFDDVRKALYVANVGAGKVQRHREQATTRWTLEAGDEIALTGLENIALSPDGKSIWAIAGTTSKTFKTIDVETFQLTATQPTAVVPSGSGYHHLEFLNDGRAFYVYRSSLPAWGDCRWYDPGSGTTSTSWGCPYDPSVAPANDGSRVAVFGFGLSPPGEIDYLEAGGTSVSRSTATQNATCGAADRHGNRLLLFGYYTGSRYESRLYDRSFAIVAAGTVSDPTLAVALSATTQDRAYTFDGAKLHAWNLGGTLDAKGLYPELWTPGSQPQAAPGANPLLVLSADEKTAFLVGDANVVVVPLP